MIGKDKTGKYHPPKGKPSGSPKKPIDVMDKKEIVDLAAESKKALRQQPADIHLRHVNRHSEKDQDAKADGA